MSQAWAELSGDKSVLKILAKVSSVQFTLGNMSTKNWECVHTNGKFRFGTWGKRRGDAQSMPVRLPREETRRDSCRLREY